MSIQGRMLSSTLDSSCILLLLTPARLDPVGLNVEGRRELWCGCQTARLWQSKIGLSQLPLQSLPHLMVSAVSLYLFTKAILSSSDRRVSFSCHCCAALLQEAGADTLQHIWIRMQQINFAKFRGPGTVALVKL